MTAFADDFSLSPEPAPAAEAQPAAGSSIGGMPFTGFVGLGLMGVVGHNPGQAGRYTGLNTDGLDAALSEFELLARSPWDSSEARYYDFSGYNLIYQTGNRFGSDANNGNSFGSQVNNSLANAGSLDFRAGDQGTWGFGIDYDSITYTGNIIDSIYTVNGGQALLNSLAPFGGGGNTRTATGATTLTATQLANGMSPFQTGTRRDIIGGNFKYIWNDWTFSGALRHEHKEGSMEEAFDGPYGGTAFALPVDYDTDRYDAIASYNTRRFQSIFQYTFSHFSDNNLFVALPYLTWNASSPYARTAAYSLPPSNDAHYLTVMLADNDLIPKTRLNFNARVGLELQNDTFAPNTADSGGSNFLGATKATNANLTGLNGSLQGTTASSPDMVAEVYQMKISASSRPMKDVDTRVYYGLDGRSVTQNQYAVYTGGTGGAAADTTPGGAPAIFSVPQDWLKQNAGAEVGYRFDHESDTKISFGYRYDSTDRSNAMVGHNRTNTGTVALTSQFGPEVDGKVVFTYADRTGSFNYLGPWAFIGQGSTYSGAFYQAPMTSEGITVRADYTPQPTVSSGVFIQFKNENYHYSDATLNNGGTVATLPLTGVGEGIKRDYALTFGPDLNLRPSKMLDVHIFYTFEMLFYDNFGNGACSTAATAATAACAGTTGNFENRSTSTTHTAGVSGDWKINEKLRLRADYTVSYGTVMFGEFNGVFVPNPSNSYQNVSNYPDINSLMNSFRVTASYQLDSGIELILQGIYTQFHNNDWNDSANQVQLSGATNTSFLLTPGYGSPNYSIAALMAGVKFRF
jgi:hypothetical protein